jgi:pSer/pThr/pTyr-binding forkhead associated (FHA) protein
MEDPKQAADNPPLPLQGPHWKHSDLEPANVLPLRLLLRPEGNSLELNRSEMVVGRHSEVDVRLRSPEVSRRHCRFVFALGQLQVFDLSSLNGVWVNGLRVQHAVLQNKDIVHIGSYDFEVEISPATLPMPSIAGSSLEKVQESVTDVLPPHPPESEKPHKKAS